MYPFSILNPLSLENMITYTENVENYVGQEIRNNTFYLISFMQKEARNHRPITPYLQLRQR